MSAWNEIRGLAERLLGVVEPGATDLSKIDAVLAPTANRKLKKVIRATRQETEPIEVLPEYQFVLEAVKEKCQTLFVTGRAGTGKSTLIRFLSEKIPNCAVVAPTALAAINVQGSTIHSFFSIPPRTLNPDEAFEPRRRIVPVIEVLGALVIDEVSMVPPDLVDCISNTLKRVRRDSRPFGGVPVIFVGDLLQLPPVVSDPEVARYYSDRYRTPYFFSADIFRDTELIPIELTKVFRQTGREFVDMLDRIRLNENHRDAVAKINRDCYRDRLPDSSSSLFLVPTNAAAKSINTRNLDTLEASLKVFDAIIEGRFDVQRDRFQAPHRLEIKEGAQIIFVKNNKPYWVNGTLGRIAHIEDDRLRIELCGTANTVNVERAVWEKIQYKYDRDERRIVSTVAGSFKQFPIALGWAITIHKSQGMTLDSVRIDLGRGAFCSGQTYVALSRSRSLEGIRLDRPISMNDVKADEMILEFYKRLEPLRDQNKASVGVTHCGAHIDSTNVSEAPVG
jgi:energy-coupling factor transporter ATP-binding protein EcfA2